MPGMIRSAWLRFFVMSVGLAGCWLGTAAPLAYGDDFGRIIGPTLFEIPQRFEKAGTRHLSVRTIESLPEVVRGERSALIIAQTGEGNLAKLLVSTGLRRRAATGHATALVPVLSLDRFETINRGDRLTRKARGREIVLFDGFEFDLDTGQVVPSGFGGDLTDSSRGASGPELAALGESRLYAIDRPLPVPGAAPGVPSAGPAVLPSDFNGRYTLVANGQTSGALELTVAADGSVSGRFRSDRNGSVYPVTGKVPADLTRQIKFEIKFPRSRQVYEGLLWTDEKNVFAGTVQILDHPYSFIALREGASLLSESVDATSAPRAPTSFRSSTRVIVLGPGADRYALDGVPKSADELSAALAGAARAHPHAEVLLRVARSAPFERVQQAVRLVRAAGIATIRLAPTAPE